MVKLLIVDDQKGIRRLLKEVFLECGYEVETCSNGLNALEVIPQFDPDLVIMDIKMPGLNGIDALRKLRETDKARLVIMMTAYGDQHYVDEAKALGACKFVNKPFDLDVLRGQVTSFLLEKDFWLGS